MNYLDPDGAGRYGILDIVEGKLLCHECGVTFKHLASHVLGAHEITATEYREKHGLGRTTRMVAPSVRARMSDSWERNKEVHLEALDSSRDVDKARALSPIGHQGKKIEHRTEVKQMYGRVVRGAQGRDLTEEEVTMLLSSGGLQEWSNVAHKLMEQKDISATSLSDACGISRATVYQRMKRYPPQ